MGCSWQPYNSSLVCSSVQSHENSLNGIERVDFSQLSSRHQREATQSLSLDCNGAQVHFSSSSEGLRRGKYHHWPLLRSVKVTHCLDANLEDDSSVFHGLYAALFGGFRGHRRGSHNTSTVLTSVDLSDNGLSQRLFSRRRKHLEAECHEFGRGLKSLNLSGNAYVSLDSLSPTCLISLEVLNLRGNRVAVASSLEGLSSLQELNLGSNGLSGLGTLPRSLKKLDLSENLLEAWPLAAAASNLSHLTELYLQDNKLKSLDFGSGLDRLLVLNLSGNSLTGSIPGDQFSRLSQLVALDLSNNKVQYVGSDTFRGLESLRVLTLENNLIDTLEADAFRDLINLRVLVLSHNKLSSLHPASFWKLSHLHRLSLDHNHLSALPRY